MGTPTQAPPDPIVYDQFDHMTRAALQAYLTERNHTFASSATKDALRRLCRYVATTMRLRHDAERGRRALDTLRGLGFFYSHKDAVAIIEETIEDAGKLAQALDQANLQIKALRQQVNGGQS